MRVIDVHLIKRSQLIIKLLSVVFLLIDVINSLHNFVLLWLIVDMVLDIDIRHQFVVFIRFYALVVRKHQMDLLRRLSYKWAATGLLLVWGQFNPA